jgi:hypothetical protein
LLYCYAMLCYTMICHSDVLSYIKQCYAMLCCYVYILWYVLHIPKNVAGSHISSPGIVSHTKLSVWLILSPGSVSSPDLTKPTLHTSHLGQPGRDPPELIENPKAIMCRCEGETATVFLNPLGSWCWKQLKNLYAYCDISYDLQCFTSKYSFDCIISEIHSWDKAEI